MRYMDEVGEYYHLIERARTFLNMAVEVRKKMSPEAVAFIDAKRKEIKDEGEIENE